MDALTPICAPPKPKKRPRIGPYSRPPALASLDMRTREGRLLRDTRTELTRHLGVKPSATQRAMIERCSYLTMQCGLLDAKLVAGKLTPHDTREYLAWCNTLTRLLRHLGLEGRAERAPSLSDHIAAQSSE